VELGTHQRQNGGTDNPTHPRRVTRLEPGVDDLVAAKLIEALRLRDPHLADHGRRTAEIACAIGADLGLAVDSLDDLYSAALLHDIGKLAVSEAILWKPSGLNRGEWTEVHAHPEEGHRLVVDVVPRAVSAAVLYHHERLDGDGYPYGVPSATLPVEVRIVQVADAFDAMTSERPYQGPVPIEAAIVEIHRCSGTQFDPEVADALTRVFDGGGARPPFDVLRGEQDHQDEDEEAPADPFEQPATVSLRG
jgi:HD-GYP domain-containing protein (c-di-GMP phosphodiesterase class II)